MISREEAKKLERKAKSLMLTKDIPQGKVDIVRSIMANSKLIDEERNKAIIELVNRGAVHARLSEASLKSGSQSKPVVEGLFGYVLPGATMRWPVPVTQGDALQVRVNGQTSLQTLSLGQ